MRATRKVTSGLIARISFCNLSDEWFYFGCRMGRSSHYIVESWDRMNSIECVRAQNDEFKALEYIYLEEFHTLKDTSPQKFIIMCHPYTGKEGEYQIKLMFEFSSGYPRTPLKYEIEPVTGITRDNMATITAKIEEIIHSNSDRPIVYEIVEEIRVWIQEYLVEGKDYQDDQELFFKKKEEVFEKPKFSTFTPVTVESFNAWKKDFEARNKLKKIEKKETEIKVTGKEWFLGKKDQIDEESDSDDEDEEDEEDEEELEAGEKKDENEPSSKPKFEDDVQNNDLF